MRLPGQQPRLKAGHRLDDLHRSYDADAELNEPFVVLTLGASLIATLGLLADNPAVVIGAMVVAPWIMPLRTAVFAILIGDWHLLRRAFRTLTIGVVITTVLSMLLGRFADMRSLIDAASGVFTDEITGRTAPTLLDLVIALVAGALATYAKLKESVVSSMAGTAIAVALVPPVCVMGLMASGGDVSDAACAGLLFVANLLGILVGGIVVLTTMEPFFHGKLLHSRRTQLPLIVAIALFSAITVPLLKGTEIRRHAVRTRMTEIKRETITRRIQNTVNDFLQNKTLTFGGNDSLALSNIDYRWASGESQSLVNIVVRVTNPTTPTYKQVEAVEKEINERIGYPLGLNFKLQVERINVSIVNGNEIVNNNNTTVDPDLLDSDLDLMKESLDQLVPLTDEEPAVIRPTTTEINHQDQKIKPPTSPVRKPETTSHGAFELEMIDEEQEVSIDEKHLIDTSVSRNRSQMQQ